MVVAKPRRRLPRAPSLNASSSRSWKISVAEPSGRQRLDVFIVDPSVKGADYSVANILAESFPADQVNEITRYAAHTHDRTSSICRSLIRQRFLWLVAGISAEFGVANDELRAPAQNFKLIPA
jgi:hypothetical protein